MRHVIIIETSDKSMINLDTESRQDYHKDCIKVLELVNNYYFTESFMQSRFFEESAIAAVIDMYSTEDENEQPTK